MALPVIPGVVRAAVRGHAVSGQTWVNVLHFQYAAGASNPGPTEIAALHAKITKLYTGPAYSSGIVIMAATPSSAGIDDVTYTPLDGSSASTVTALAAAGTSVAEALPPEVSPVLTVRTALRGRSYRGRVYLAIGTEADNTSVGQISTTARNGWLAQWVGFAADLPSIQWTFGVASYLRGLYTVQTSMTMDTKWDVQRRRK